MGNPYALRKILDLGDNAVYASRALMEDAFRVCVFGERYVWALIENELRVSWDLKTPAVSKRGGSGFQMTKLSPGIFAKLSEGEARA
jgi:hypothetical protein